MTVDRLHPVLAHHIVNTLGWPTLRPLQQEAISPILDGHDAVLLAPTAGGKTEAAVFPLLTAMEDQGWRGLSVVYVCPLKALLNNLAPRVEAYASWLGRTAMVWHGDVGAAGRQKILRDNPDILLTTPESLEAMLVSTKIDHERFFHGLRAIVADEVHAFAGDDRGWHLLAVAERLTRVCGRPLQRIGLSATVGNPDDLVSWLQGAGRGRRPATVVAPEQGGSTSAVEIEVDYVGSVDNAATVIAALHRGEKRLVFCDSRALVEKLGAALRERDVTTFLSHASLSVDERRQAEAAFADARDCVIVSTSTLELGIDVGDLDRVIQINAPATVASFLQRLGRSGRRAGTSRNCLFLALDERSLLWAAGLLRLWTQGFVEPVVAPPEPRHIVAQQFLARCLQDRVEAGTWAEEWNGLAPFDRSAEPIVTHLLNESFVERDGEQLFIGPTAEENFGRRHFMDMTAVFTAPPQFTLLEGRREIGQTDPSLLTDRVQGPRLLLLAGRSWRVTWIDWARRRCYVEAVDRGGRARWTSGVMDGRSFAMTRAVREVVLGEDPPVPFTERARTVLEKVRAEELATAHPGGLVITHRGVDLRWWTWAGFRANATLTASLSTVTDGTQRFDDVSIRLRNDLTVEDWRAATRDTVLCLPEIDVEALNGLKFAAALPHRLAVATLAARLADLEGAAHVLGESTRFVK